MLQYIQLQLKKRNKNIKFLDIDGEEIDKDDLHEYLENFNEIFVNNKEEPKEYKLYEYTF